MSLNEQKKPTGQRSSDFSLFNLLNLHERQESEKKREMEIGLNLSAMKYCWFNGQKNLLIFF